MRKKQFYAIAGMSLLAIAALSIRQVQSQTRFDLQGQFLAVISDGDFFASTYVDGRIPGADSRYRDALTLIPLPFDGERVSVEVSNSVNGPPETLALSPDGRTAYVVEYMGQRPVGATTRSDLLAGRFLSQVDLTDPRQPRVLSRIEVGHFPEAIDVHPEGKWVAIATDSSESEVLQLVPVQDSSLGEPMNISLESLGIPAAEGPLNASYVEWHPSGEYLVVNLYRQNRIVFLRFTQDSTGEANLSLWGNPVAVDVDPYSGRLTPDGKHFITANWKRDFTADSLEGRLPSEPSTVSVIRLDVDDSASENHTAYHQVITTVASAQSSEGIAISPDGTLVATANMRDTALPTDSPRFTRDATVSLFAFDAVSGQLAKAADFAFEGVLPEGLTFDATGEHLIVATFEYLNSEEPGGGLEVWRISQEPAPNLEYVGRINVPHGSHQVVVAP
ncbi:beta-propeller fold lactonase family protein [Leptolyngbya sp. FACHB-671]|uniref:beta-propeller fold lactonase family protein n=1 Tax=Leptolyngbya sp. FACHB-671 TaxID=2692812 RepID=UPI001682A14A|nr:beta-propeller fold lactonase family protein [Leptolyngbya sp. FACHB-671]